MTGPEAPSARVSEAELLEYEAAPRGPWTWVGWNFGGEAFWDRGRDDHKGALHGPDDVILEGATTEGEDPRVVVASPEAARLIADAPKLVAEIRRLRALLLGVIARREQDGNPYPCPCCDQNLPHFAEEVCPWPELEAEVQAIRAER